MKSRRSRIIDLLDSRKSDEVILRILDQEYPDGTFSTSNKQALNGTKWDLRIPNQVIKPTLTYPKEVSEQRDIVFNHEDPIKHKKQSRRSRIINLLDGGKSDKEILRVLNEEYPEGTFSTTNKQALYGTKRDLKIPNHIAKPAITHPKDTSKHRIIVFNREGLIKQLRSFNPDPIIERYRLFDLSGKTPKDLLSFSMGSNIYRAFHHETPSLRYAQWRWHNKAELLYKEFFEINDQDTFDAILLDTAKSLVEDWGARNEYGNPSKMNIGIALKITNLIFKHYFFSQPNRNPSLRRFLHVPWDIYTLGPLQSIWEGTPLMPPTPSQGFVKYLQTYNQLNVLITGIALEAEVDRIIYEFWAWDNSH